jgi:peptidoglycan/LPS O-acetylase OafA/YrhL
MQFRIDINGLRAIAVIAVVLFHFKAQWLPGGFSGVDVFFVISGYLMTAIIFTKIDRHSFSIFDFYKSRGRRIIPPLAILCSVLLIFGWFNLYPTDFKALAKHTFTSLLFVSNFIYANENGYFTAAITEKWLLHTWSLSVEWQFYILFPLLVLLLKKTLKTRSVSLALIALTLLSFLFTLYAANQFPDKAFFLLPTRAWELFAGGLVFLFPLSLTKKKQYGLEILGLALIIFGYFYIQETDLWPGLLTLLPILGACLLLLANNQDSLITGNPILQRIGSASYSIYLWHWPVYVYMHHQGWTHSTSMLICGIAVSVLFGWCSYYFIEQQNKRAYLSNAFPKPLVLFLPVVILAILVYSFKGVTTPIRPLSQTPQAEFIERYKSIDLGDSYFDQCNAYKSLKSQNKADISPQCTASLGQQGVMLWGDSHAQALSKGLRTYLPKGVEFYQVASSGCKPSLLPKGITSTIGKACDSSNQLALDTIAKVKPAVVILAQAEHHEKTDWIEFQERLLALGAENVVVIGPVPQWRPSLPYALAQRHWQQDQKYIEDSSIDIDIIETNKLLHRKLDSKIGFISLIDNLCIHDGLSCQAQVNEVPLVFDYGHLTPTASLFVSRQIILPQLITLLAGQKGQTATLLGSLELTDSTEKY